MKNVIKPKKILAKTSKTRAARKDGTATAVLPLTWIGTEYVPHKRWWWYIGFTIVMIWLSALLMLLHEWYTLALVVTATVTVFVMYLPKPRKQQWSLDGTTLTVDKTAIQLQKYRAFTLEELPATKTVSPRMTITLLPKRRFGWAFPVYLPDSEERAADIADQLESTLPFDDAAGYLSRTRQLNRLVRWLRLG